MELLITFRWQWARPTSGRAGKMEGAAFVASRAGRMEGVAFVNSFVNGGTSGRTLGGAKSDRRNGVGRTARMALVTNTPETTTKFSKQRGRLTVEFPAVVAAAEEGKLNTRDSPRDDSFRYAWARGKYTKLGRTIKAYSFITQLLAKNYAIGKPAFYWNFKITDEAKSAKTRALSAWIREEILKLGPCFIKVGQLASTRADIFPAEVVEELALLQDRVPGIQFQLIREIVEVELGMTLEEAFVEFDPVPLAAASLGQVHRARLLSDNGAIQDVVVKVQRPALKGLFDVDLESLKTVAYYLQRSKKFGGNGRDWVGIYDECKDILYEEIDYTLEGRSAEEFGRNLSEYEWIRVPKIFWEQTTTRVLTMQYMPGIKISDKAGLERAGLDTSVVAQRSAESYLKQILGSGFFHADPHSGNVAVGPGEVLFYYDFGMMGRLNTGVKDKLIDLLFGVFDKDAEVVMNGLFDLGALVRVSDPAPIRRAIQYFLDNLQSKPMKEQTISAIGDDLYAVAYDNPFRFPATFTFVLRAFSTLEGINRQLDPDFKFAEVAQPFADEIIGVRNGDGGRGALLNILFGDNAGQGNIGGRLRDEAQKQLPATLSAPSRIAKIDRTLEKIERGDTKLRARTADTERLLAKQYKLTESTNYVYASGILTICATQLATAGQLEFAGGLGALAGVLGLFYVKTTRELKKDPFNREKDTK